MSTGPGPGGRSATFLVGLLLIVALAFTYAGLRHNGFVTAAEFALKDYRSPSFSS